ncbi:hypothetical protein [Sphingomonas sp. CCH18-B1]|jgi:hypothetical protein|uniref:hypothetical protein n=1 Tax=Sphingomonas sp. CCH18-B1 TaxID=1768744 RepID=UPI000AAC4D14|nr:hypothetical protein [Sphingomonas sp. CCH18-B1]
MYDDKDVLKSSSSGYFMNPQNPLDPSTPYGQEQLNKSSRDSIVPAGVMTGWRRIAVLAALLGWFILVGTWTPS